MLGGGRPEKKQTCFCPCGGAPSLVEGQIRTQAIIRQASRGLSSLVWDGVEVPGYHQSCSSPTLKTSPASSLRLVAMQQPGYRLQGPKMRPSEPPFPHLD